MVRHAYHVVKLVSVPIIVTSSLDDAATSDRRQAQTGRAECDEDGVTFLVKVE